MSSSSSSSSSSRATGSSSSAGGSGVPTATVPGASYDQLLWQVELLKMENSTLRQELQHNSSHLCKLETEASNMKEVLKQLQGTIEEETSDIPTQLDFMERMKEMSMEPSSLVPVKLRANKPAAPPAAAAAPPPLSQGPHGASYPKRGAPPPPAALSPPGDASQTPAGYLEQLQQDRSLLLAELDKEEKEKEWYYGQLQNLTMRIDSLPLSDNFSLQTDMTRRQLEFEARQLRGAMEEQLGSCQDMERRALARLSRIQHIEKDLLRGGQRLLHTEDKTEGVQMCADSSNAATNPQVCEQDSTSEASSTGGYSIPRRLTSHLGTKVEMVYSLLSMLGTHDKDDMSRTLLAMSSSQDSCIAMRQSGCLPLLIQLLHGSDKDSLLLGNSRGSKEARARASAALHNIVHSRPDDKRARREARVLHLLEQVRVYCEACWTWQEEHQAGTQPDKNPVPSPGEHQICPAVCVLMKLSFDEEHRHAMNELGGLQAIAELLQADCELYGLTADHQSITLRRYAGMALTNLTFGDVGNKATLCSMKGCMRAMVAQLKSDSEDLQQVVASVLRNLSWRADASSKKTLREVGSVAALMSCGLHVQKESTLKSVLSALWNLSAHCSDNKAELCAVGGALGFLARALAQRGPASAALAVVESAGGILRNVSSLVATNQAYRQVLRDNGCLATLLQHLRSPSLTVVSNACGTLWNLSARDPRDQEALWEMGAVAMLRNLVHSRHKMIAMGSAAALRNLLANRPAKYSSPASAVGGAGPGGDVAATPSLHARKHKALIEELDAQRQQLSETFDGLENLGPVVGGHHPRRHRQPSPSATQHHHLQQRGPGVRRHKGDEEGGARSPYANTPVLSSPRAPPRPPALAWPAASSDSLHSVGSADGYGATEDERLLEDARLLASRQEEEEDEEEEEEEEAAYRRYPADLAHKIHSANSMADAADAELDTPINYSLKYSDEQLHSGRQSPAPAAAQSRGREREKEEEEAEEAGGRQEERRRPYQAPYRAGSRADGQNPRTPHRSDGDDFGEGERPGHRHEQEPIDYSIKYGGHASPGRAASSSASSCKSNASGQKPLPPKAPGGGVNQDTPLTYCVEDTPICFSRGSSLSSLSSGDEDDERRGGRRRAGGRGHAHYPTLPVGQKEERDDSPAIAMTTGPSDGLSPDAPGQRQYARLPRAQQHHHGNQQLHHPHSNHHHHHQQPQAPAAPKTPPPVAPSSAPSSALASALETPLMFSRCTSLSSLDSFGSPSIASSLPSEPCSGGASGVVSPSDLPDSPGQTMPPSRNKTPPPPAASLKPPVSDPPAATACLARAQRDHAGARGPAGGGKREEEEEDFLLHFATESTPHGFSRASSLSALSVDEPFIPRQPAAQDLGQERSAPVAMVTSSPDRGLEATGGGGDEVDAVVGDDDDDDISILEACIHLAMPTRSSRRPKKPVTTATGGAPAPPPAPQGSEVQMAGSPGSVMTAASRKPSLLPVYKLLPQQHRPRPLEEETPRVYCVEDTPLSFSTATSLSDLTIDSPPAEVAPGNPKDRRHAPIAVATREEEQEVKEEASKVPDDEENEDILAECISAAMPKPRPQRNPPQPQRHAPPADANAANTTTAANAAVCSLAQRESELRPKPTSPVKPMVAQRPAPPPPSQPAGGQRRRFAYDSPHHYTPIEGTPCCFSRNDSLSSLDFDDEEEGPEGSGDKRRSAEPGGRLSVPDAHQKPAHQKPAPPAAAVLPRSKEGAEPPPSGAAPDDGRQQRFAVEDTPVCFSRNSSLSSLSDIMDQENNNVASPPSPPPPPQEPPAQTGPQPLPQALVPAPQAPPQAVPPNGQLANPGRAGYAPRAFAVEDTPVCFSRNSSLSSLSIDSEDDLLLECISSAMPKRKHLLPAPPPPAVAQPLPSTPPSHPAEEEEEGDLKEEDEEEEAFDWKAIQEGANSVVSSLNQAAVSDPPQDSSDEDSDSVLSLRSGLSLSLGSPFHRMPRPAATAVLPEEEPAAEGRGGAAGEEEEDEEGEEEEVEDEPEDQEGPEEYAAPQQPVGVAGACPRGGARVLRPGERSTLEEKRRKEEEERSTALKGGKKVYRSLLTGRPRPQTDATPPAPRPRPQSDTPPPAPRPRPQTEAAPRPRPQSDTPPSAMATPSPRGRALKAPGAGLPPPRLSTKTPPSRRAEPGEGGRGRGASSSRSGSRDSTPSRRPAPLTSSSSSSTSSSSKSPGAAPPTSRLSCPSPGRPAKQAPPPGPPLRKSNSGGRSTVGAAAGPSGEGVERPALVRQSTFIKEAPSSAPGRKRSEEAPPPAPDTQSSSTRPAPSSRSTVSSSSSSSSLNNNQNPNRSHSESPSPSPRLSRTGTWKREGGGRRGEVEGGQHGSSLPRVGTWKRAGSSSSLLSASSSSSRGDQEEARGTWRKAKEQQEEVWVRMEDCPVNSPRPSSSSSSSSNAPPVISAPSPPKTSVTMTTASRPSPNANLNLRSRSRDSLDAPPPAAAPGRTGPFERAGPGKAYLGGGGGGAGGGGGGGTVAARVSPFNYVPSPRKSSADASAPASSHTPSASSTRPSLIPSPVALSAAGGGKKRPQQTPPSPSPSKGDGSERGSYIVTSV